MRILFISRAFPPVIGGIENQNHALSVWLPKYTEVTTIANRHGRLFLPFFAPYALLRALLGWRSYDVLLLGDGTIAIIGWFVKKLTDKKVITIIHGIDINYNSSSLKIWFERWLISLYQTLWVRIFLPSLDGYITVSTSTKELAIKHDLNPKKCFVIPNGVDTDAQRGNFSRTDLSELLGHDTSDKVVLLTAGRLVKRKGVAWFIRNVFPKLPNDTLYAVSGAGPEESAIRAAVTETKTDDRVVLLGRVSDEDRRLLLNTADIFVQPNIPIAGDMEGFGIAVIEATSAGLPVVASRLEGLQEAITDGGNGILVEPENAEAFVRVLDDLIAHPDKRTDLGTRAARFTEEHFHWKHIAKKYISTLEEIFKETR